MMEQGTVGKPGTGLQEMGWCGPALHSDIPGTSFDPLGLSLFLYEMRL